MAGTTEPLAEKPKTFDTVGDLPAMPKLNEGASKLTGASKAEFEKALGVYQPFLTAQEGMVKGLGRAESDILQSEQEQKRIQATGTSAAAQKQVADIEKGQRDLDEAMQKEPIPKFVPTKETADDLVVLFSLVNVMGFLIGGAGKENSQAAMSAMNGMLEGHQKGRADLYKQELSEFDKNFKAMVQKHAEFRKRYEDAVKLAAVDKEAGVAQAELVATEYGSEVVKAKAKKGDILGGLEILNSGLNAVKEAQKRVEKIEDEANKRQYELDKEKDRRRFELDMQKASFANAEKIARMKSGGGAAVSGMSQKELFEDAAKAIANYAEKPPALRDPQRNALLARARQINPTYNEAGYGDRDIAYRNWINPNGAGFKQIAAFTTVAGHLDTLDKLGEALKNKDTQAINSAYNWFQTATGDASVTNFNAAKQAVAAETIKAITGTAGALRDREEAAAIFAAVQSPAQLKGAISTVKELINSRLQTSQAMFEAGTGRRNFEELLPPIVKRTFQTGGAPQAAAAPTLTGAAAIPTGAAKPSSQQVDIKTYPVIGKTPDGRPVHQAPDGKKSVE